MIRPRQKIGKYQIERNLGEGGFAAVYQALDTIEGVRVALKVPFSQYISKDVLDVFRREVRMVAQLDHSNILPLKNAEFIDGTFVLAFPLGERSLAERLQSRLSASLALNYSEQILDAVAYAHQRRIIHCDIKPENLILFPENRLLLTDFGIAKVALRTVKGSGSGTVGHVAPEQAMGKPSFRSDVFSVGLIMYRMFSGHWPEWPFSWPPPGIRRVRERLHGDLVEAIRRSLEIDPRKRFRDGDQMLAAFRRVKNRALLKSGASTTSRSRQRQADWRTVRFQQFRRKYSGSLGPFDECPKCRGPVSEPMRFCPWCADPREMVRHETRFPQQCPRCHRGMKLDWSYCPWCFGPGFDVQVARQFTDERYVGTCSNAGCKRKSLMPFMKYCPWCRRKVRRRWKLAETPDTCDACGWGVARDFWNCCAWCGTST